MKRLPLFPVLLCVAAPVVGQHHAVVPAAQEAAEGGSSALIEGIGHDGRQQILIAGRHLTGLAGRSLDALTFRRDHGQAFVSAGGAVHLTLRVGPADRSVYAPSTTFAHNVTGAVEVFRGVVQLPSADAGSAPSTAWTGDNALRIPFHTPYAYAGGDLCLELDGAPVGSEPIAWYPDGIAADAEGTVQSVGDSCGHYGNADGTRSLVGGSGLVAGGQPRFTTLGTPGATAFLGLAFDLRAQPLDLTALGATGCRLRIDPVVTVPTVVSAPLFGAEFGGFAEVRATLPASAGVLGARLVAQWIELGGATPLSTSEALDCQVAAQAPGLGISTVSQRETGPATLALHRAPVLRFDAR